MTVLATQVSAFRKRPETAKPKTVPIVVVKFPSRTFRAVASQAGCHSAGYVLCRLRHVHLACGNCRQEALNGLADHNVRGKFVDEVPVKRRIPDEVELCKQVLAPP